MSNHHKLEAQFNRANISDKDFAEAESYLRIHCDDLPNTLRRALFTAAIIAYARPFTSNDSGTKGLATGTLVRNPKRILDEKEFALHKKILILRNEAIAHSSYERKPTRFAGTVGTAFLAWTKSFDVLSEEISASAFLTICLKMKRHCTDTLFSLSRDLDSQSSERRKGA